MVGAPSVLALIVLTATSLAACARAPESFRSPIPRPDVGMMVLPAHPYLTAVAARIQQYWAYPCTPDNSTGGCDYLQADLIVEVAINPDGRLATVRVARSSGIPLYDDTAVNAVKRAAPFGPVPAELRRGPSAMAAIQMRFNYLNQRRAMPARDSAERAR